MKNLSRLFVLLLLASASLLIPSASQAGIYTVKQCDYWNYPGWVTDDSQLSFSTNRPGVWDFENDCGGGIPHLGKGIIARGNVTYNQGDVARYKMSLAGTDLGFTSVSAQPWTPNGPTGFAGWTWDYLLHDNGSNGITIPWIMDYHPFTYTVPSSGQRTDFEARLKCSTAATCTGGAGAGIGSIFVGSVHATIRDESQPLVFAGGTLTGGGIKSGTKTISALGVDGLSSGIKEVRLYVNGQLTQTSGASSPFPGVTCSGASTFNSLRPCPGTYSKEWTVNTAQAPFTNGANGVAVCSIDYSGNAACVNPGTVNILN